jgi:hypothetical protein
MNACEDLPDLAAAAAMRALNSSSRRMVVVDMWGGRSAYGGKMGVHLSHVRLSALAVVGAGLVPASHRLLSATCVLA